MGMKFLGCFTTLVLNSNGYILHSFLSKNLIFCSRPRNMFSLGLSCSGG